MFFFLGLCILIRLSLLSPLVVGTVAYRVQCFLPQYIWGATFMKNINTRDHPRLLSRYNETARPIRFREDEDDVESDV